jgi:ATP-binding cassette subfamily C (CFTR/MRP) protein 1
MNLTLKKGQFTAIIGDVGSGKSSVLSTLIGDLRHLGEDFATVTDEGATLTTEVKRQLSDNGFQKKFDKETAPVVIPNNISYTQQTPWIQNKTIRENIVAFGPPIEDNMEKYKHVIKICELKRDLQTALKAGDKTEIGEKGINLSGGQKARIGLARSVYADTDVYLMDDPLSALDANVKKSIFENVFREELFDKTRILVTHAIDFVPFVDYVVVMDKGKVLLEGKYSDIENHEYMQSLMESHEQNTKTNTAVNAEHAVVERADEMSDFDPDENDNQGEGKMMSNENDEVIQVNFSTYYRYFIEYYGGWRFVFTSQIAMLLFLTSQFLENYIVGSWADDPK